MIILLIYLGLIIVTTIFIMIGLVIIRYQNDLLKSKHKDTQKTE